MTTNPDPQYVTRWRHRTGRCKNYRASAVRDYKAFALHIANRYFAFLKRKFPKDFFQEIEVIVAIAKQREGYDRLGAKRFKNLVNRQMYAFAKNYGFRRKGGYYEKDSCPHP